MLLVRQRTYARPHADPRNRCHSSLLRLTPAMRRARRPAIEIRVRCAAALLALPAAASAQTFKSSAGDLKVETVAGGLSHPWALAFLPDGRMLVTERPGRMRIVTRGRQVVGAACKACRRSSPSGQGGLHDVVLDRDFAQNKTIYFCYAEPAERRRAHRDGACDARRRQQLDDVKVIFHQDGPLSSGNHFGCRIAQSAGQQPVPDARRPLHPTATRRRTSPTISARSSASRPTARCRRTIRSSAATTPSRKSGAYGHRNAQGAGDPSHDRQAVGARARPARRRRGQHLRAGQELRLAGDRLRRQLRRHAGRQRHREAGHGAAGQILGAVDRAVRHGVLHGRPVSGLEGQPVRRRAGRRRCWCGSPSTATRSPARSACCRDLRERIRDVRIGPDGAIYLAHRQQRRPHPARHPDELGRRSPLPASKRGEGSECARADLPRADLPRADLPRTDFRRADLAPCLPRMRASGVAFSQNYPAGHGKSVKS